MSSLLFGLEKEYAFKAPSFKTISLFIVLFLFLTSICATFTYVNKSVRNASNNGTFRNRVGKYVILGHGKEWSRTTTLHTNTCAHTHMHTSMKPYI